jgi:hypothetical protein
VFRACCEDACGESQHEPCEDERDDPRRASLTLQRRRLSSHGGRWWGCHGGQQPGGRLAAGEGVIQRADESGASRVARAGILRQRALEDPVDGRRKLGPTLGGRRDGLVDVRRGLGRVRPALERSRAREELVAEDSERVEVAGRPCGLSERLLGSKVAGGAEHGAGGRHTAVGVVGDPRDPEIGDGEIVPFVEEEVRRLDVAVNDSETVSGVKRLRSLPEPGESGSGSDRLPPRTLSERPARQVLHDDEWAPLPLADVEDRDDVRVAGEPSRRQGFALEAFPEPLVVREAVIEDLDGHLAAELPVLGEVDPAHASLADEARVRVSVREDSCLN